jgi:hypothetical protein
MESANWEHAKPLTSRPTATMSVALPLSRQVPAAQDFIGIPRIFESQLILRINNSKTVGQKSMTLTPYLTIFYEQVFAAQDFAKIATTSRTQLHENKDFRYQQEKMCAARRAAKKKGRPRRSA